MNNSISNFIDNFQDMIVTKQTTIEQFPRNLSPIDLNIINSQLLNLAEQLTSLSDLTKLASVDAGLNYKKMIKILEDKINYISDTSDILFKINSFYDSYDIKDIYNYDLRSINKNTGIIFDDNQKGLTLKSKVNLYKCSKFLSGNTMTFYNTNFCYHSGISFESNFLDLLNIKSITIRKSDGTVIDLAVPDFQEQITYIKHDLLTSSQIIIEFGVNPSLTSHPEYYSELDLSLIDYNYESEGYGVFNNVTYTSADIFNIISDFNVPANCYLNLNFTINLLDINNNIIYEKDIQLPISGRYLCTRLDNLDFDKVESIIGLYIKNNYTTEDLNVEYLKGLSNKNEKYLIYISKEYDSLLINNYLSLISNLGFKLNQKQTRYIDLSLNIELFSFNERLSPLLKNITGITKNETI